MFDTLNQIREAWKESSFVLIDHSNDLFQVVDMVIPTQAIRADHISEMRNIAGGIIYCTLPYNFCKSIDLPFMEVIYEGISSRYYLISIMLKNSSKRNDVSSYSISIDHVDVGSGLSNNDMALTLSSLGNIVDDFIHANLKRSNLLRKFGSTYQIPGHIPILRGSHGLLRKKISIAELSLALCEICDQLPSTTICRIIANEDEDVIEKANELCEQKDYPLVDKQVIINLWRSIKKIPKDEIFNN